MIVLAVLAMVAALTAGAAWAGDSVPLKDGYADLDGARVHYVTVGQGSPAVVLVHHWGGNISAWNEQIPVLEKSHLVLAVDMPGHGLSDAPERDYTLKYLARGVVAAMDKAEVKRAVLAGHSLGGAVIRQVALDYPDRVSGLILVDAAILFKPVDPAELAKWKQNYAAFADRMKGPEGEKNTAAFVDSIQGPETPAQVKDRVRQRIMGTPRQVRLSAMAGMIDPKAWDWRPVKVPTLAVYAASDHRPPNFEDLLKKLFPNLTYHQLTGVGHWFLETKPEPLNRWMLEFLARPDLAGKGAAAR